MRVAALALALLLVAIGWLLRPLAHVGAPDPLDSATYAEAVHRLDALRANDPKSLHAGCGTEALLSGQRTPRAIVLFHGITNCPLQFHELAVRLHEGGDNVVVPRVPEHGLADRMTGALARLTAEDLTALATECVGLAHGLGDTVVVVGLSTSGVLAAWSAQQLDVDRAVVIAPAFAPPWRPSWLAPLVTRVALRLPNRFVWWDDQKREALPGPEQCYPRFSTHAMGQAYRLGEDVWASLRRSAPRAHDLAVVTTLSDHAIDNARADSLAARWRARGARVRAYTFRPELAVGHDMIDPRQVGARIDIVYPVLVPLVRGEALPSPN
jgi:esterase/lipase